MELYSEKMIINFLIFVMRHNVSNLLGKAENLGMIFDQRGRFPLKLITK